MPVTKDLHWQMSYVGKCWLLLSQTGATTAPYPSPPCAPCGNATTLHATDAAQPSPSSQT